MHSNSVENLWVNTGLGVYLFMFPSAAQDLELI